MDNRWTDAAQAQIFPSLMEVGIKLLSTCPESGKTLFPQMKFHLLDSSEPYRDSIMLVLMYFRKFASATVKTIEVE